MIDFQSAVLDPTYAVFGIECTLTPLLGLPIAVTVISKLSGLEVMESKTGVSTIKPAVAIRVYELSDNHVKRSDIRGGSLNMNDKCWRIETTLPKPGIASEETGELYLILSEVQS